MIKVKNDLYGCPACMSQDIKSLIQKKLISFLFPVPKEIIPKINREDISIFVCNFCSHVFQVNVDNKLIDVIYSEFYKHYNLDTSIEFQNIYRERTLNFIGKNIKNINNNKYKMLDIGCGEGTYFPYFSKNEYSCYGFEPSEKHHLASMNNPDAVISSSYFEETDGNIFDVNFDIILLNWVLEHVLDLDHFFSILKNYCKTGTKIIFQVPDLMYYVENDLYLFYVHEHIHYFTQFSIKDVLKRHGFTLKSFKNSDCPSLIVCAEYTNELIKINPGDKIHQSTKEIIRFVDKGNILGENAINIFDLYEEIYFYGVGTASYWLGEYYLPQKIKSRVKIIDDNEYYFEKYVPSFNSIIMKLGGINLSGTSVFFIGTSPVYRDMIIYKIYENISGSYDIAYIKDNKFNIIKHTV